MAVLQGQRDSRLQFDSLTPRLGILEAMLQSKAHVRLTGERLPPQQIVVEGRITAACPETHFQSLIGTRLEPQQCMVKGQWFSGSSAHPLLSRISRLPTTPGQGQCYKLSDFRARSTRASHRV